MKQLQWYGLYREGWEGEITPDAFKHPAKFSRALIRKIYRHMLDSGYIKPGQTIVDPFGGVALGAIDALRNGLHWRGVELERNFVELGRANIDLWNNRYAAHFPNWGTAEIVQGDSRRLAAVLREAGGVVSSPPYAETINGSGSVSSLKWTVGKRVGMKNDKMEKRLAEQTTYADNSPGQLGSMKEGDIAAVVDGAISSPPYAEAVQGKGEGPGARYDTVFHSPENATKKSSANGYGSTDGQLGSMAVTVTYTNRHGIIQGNKGDDYDRFEKNTANRNPGKDVPGRKEVAGTDSRRVWDGQNNCSEVFEEGGGKVQNTIGGAQAGLQNGTARGGFSVRGGSLALEGRQVEKVVQGQEEERNVRGLRGDRQPPHSSRGLRPLQQRPQESANSLPFVSYEPTQKGVLAGEEGGRKAEEEQRAGRVGQVAGAISSPPYEDAANCKGQQRNGGISLSDKSSGDSYGSTPNNIGNATGPTFWAAARDILLELYAVLTPGGYAAFVTGNYRRDGKVVPFGEQWLQLCEAVGFVGIEHITAWKYEPRPAQLDIFGNAHNRDVHRVSFFRRLDNQKNPGNEILSEDVWIVRKPVNEGVA